MWGEAGVGAHLILLGRQWRKGPLECTPGMGGPRLSPDLAAQLCVLIFVSSFRPFRMFLAGLWGHRDKLDPPSSQTSPGT